MEAESNQKKMFDKILGILLAVIIISIGVEVFSTGGGRIIYGYYANFGKFSVVAGPSFVLFGVFLLLSEILAILKTKGNKK